jgi:hypothetical protein
MEILNVRLLNTGYLVNGLITVLPTDADYPLVEAWVSDGKEVMPLHTQSELNKLSETSKQNELNKFLSALTVQRPEALPVTLGFKFSADPQSLANISLEIDTMLDTDTRIWYEDWGSQEVTKQELQEAKRLASEAKQAKLAELFGV